MRYRERTSMSSDPAILCLNSGSSSLKFALVLISQDGESKLAAGSVEGIGLERGRLQLRLGDREAPVDDEPRIADAADAIERAFDALGSAHLRAPNAIGHRVVHGGDRYTGAVRIDDGTLTALGQLSAFAPLHMPAELRAIEATRARYPALPQVACFDTAFHRSLPERARRLPLPQRFHEQSIRRYGFHGLSYAYVVEALATKLGRRSVIAHLGNGASMVALLDRRPIDTTMSFTPAGGLMMGTRTGDIDPGVLIHLLKGGCDAGDVERVIQHQSGLLGVSGSTPDMKTLLQRRATDGRAALAVEMFCYRAKTAIGTLAAALGGLDTLVFTGGIGEHASPVRTEICLGLEFLGIELDTSANDAGSDVISRAGSACTVRVVATDEELTIARESCRLLFPALAARRRSV
jgi:acetate kinase